MSDTVTIDDATAERRRAAFEAWPEADVSKRNVARLIGELPEALVSAMSEAAEEARALAFHADRMIRRFRDMEAAVAVLVGASAFGNGSELVLAIEDRTDLRVVWEVLHGIGAAVDESHKNAARELQRHASDHWRKYGDAPTRLV